MRARLAELGGTVRAGLPADFGKLILEETEKCGKVIRPTNIKPEWGGSEPTILLDSPQRSPLLVPGATSSQVDQLVSPEGQRNYFSAGRSHARLALNPLAACPSPRVPSS
jgi:hypothetical protein